VEEKGKQVHILGVLKWEEEEGKMKVEGGYLMMTPTHDGSSA